MSGATNDVKVSTSVALSTELLERLDAEAAKQDRSRSYITSAAIKEYLSKREAAADDR